MDSEIKDSAWVTIEWEGASLKLGIDCSSAEHLTPEDIGRMVEECLTAALERVGSQCVAN